MTDIKTLSFLLPVTYPDANIEQGLDDALEVFRYGESLGYDSGWVRQRHLEYNLSSAIVFLSAVSQHTSRIDLGVAALPLGYENSFRLAEHLLTLDALARGRLQTAVSVGLPMYYPLIADTLRDAGTDADSFASYARITRLQEYLRGELPLTEGTPIPEGVPVPVKVQPERVGVADRIWYAATGAESARRAAENGLNFTTAIVTKAVGDLDFFAAQARLAAEFLDNRVSPDQRFMLGRTILPFDNAGESSRERFLAHGAWRLARNQAHSTAAKRTLEFPDITGRSHEIVEKIAADPIIRLTGELRVEIPYHFPLADVLQILHDLAVLVAPQLGWKPALPAAAEPALTPAGAAASLR